MTKHYPKKHLLGQKIESWKGLLIFAFLNSSSSHKRENEKLCVLKCSKKLPREQRLDQLLHLSTVCLATANCSILSAKPTAISPCFSLFQKHLCSEILWKKRQLCFWPLVSEEKAPHLPCGQGELGRARKRFWVQGLERWAWAPAHHCVTLG